MNKKLIGFIAVVTLGIGAFAVTAVSEDKKKDAPKVDRHFTLVNFQYKGSKVWLPGTMIVKRGETIGITLVNNAPSGVHGYAIDDFGIKVEVPSGEKVSVMFKAKKKGLFQTYCQIHKAHIGGQILVQ